MTNLVNTNPSDPSSYYFYGPVPYDEEESYFIFISKEFWDAGQELDCIPEPQELFDILEKIQGFELMENAFEFDNTNVEQVKQQLIQLGFIENNTLRNSSLM